MRKPWSHTIPLVYSKWTAHCTSVGAKFFRPYPRWRINQWYLTRVVFWMNRIRTRYGSSPHGGEGAIHYPPLYRILMRYNGGPPPRGGRAGLRPAKILLFSVWCGGKAATPHRKHFFAGAGGPRAPTMWIMYSLEDEEGGVSSMAPASAEKPYPCKGAMVSHSKEG